ncbi:carbohydrate ABC transporter permease [Phytoactinopolyspora halotolerans]|uniref:Sugar ABC transporter permease n=1 Tax=Phytoactinopolyspora halotolerans TaxID=1981512 RepID=A0A6L9S9F1_9ACTN|nr:sugar ABC transporter permease [Phytoactinopolyspora halotolerans]NEE01663.1 sugar ABC transporter permease [Phytoactinopolyspora halotolerans]
MASTALSPRRTRRGRAGDGARRPIRRHAPWTPYAFMAPFLIIFVTFVAAPAVFGVWMSLHDWDYMLPEKPFVGFDNYLNLFDPASAAFEMFWNGIQATAVFTVASVPLLVAIPLGLAVLLNRRFAGRTFFRAVFFMPYVLGVAVVGLLFRFILDPNIGVINAAIDAVGLDSVLNAVGIGTPIPWITAQPWAWISLVVMTVWWTLGFNTIIYLAGLQDIPSELYDAAKVDGASRWQQFRYVTLPGLRAVLLFVVVITVLASANMFGQSVLVTGGGPGDSTRTALMVILGEGLESFRMGSAAAMSYLLAVFLGIVSIVNVLAVRGRRQST